MQRKFFTINYKIIVYLLLLGLLSSYLFNILQLKIKPDIILISIFFFSIFDNTRPNFLALIIIGLILDIYNIDLFGIRAVLFIISATLAASNSDSLKMQKFNIVWGSFSATILTILVCQYVTLLIFTGNNNIDLMVIMSAIATILLYPLLHLVYAKKLKYFQKPIT